MIRRLLTRHAYPIALAGILATIFMAGGFVLAVALPDLQRSASVSPSPAPSPQASGGFMTWVAMPADADCAACHITANGAVGLRPVPKIAHAVQGWEDCTACHATNRLVATAPGHTGIHASACLTCHQPATLPPPLSRPHRELQNQECLSCHGKTAPLPADMQHRSQTVCWLCHRLPEEQPPLPQHAVTPGQTDCLTCHVAGKVGALPADHATRSPSECLLCHGQPAGSPTPTSTPEPTATGQPPSAEGELLFVLSAGSG